MSRTAGSSGARTMEAIRRAGIKRLYKQGFEAMKLRDLADDVGIQAGSLYNYIRQKQDLLFMILSDIMERLHEGLSAELEGIEDPVEELRRFIAFHIRWHTARKEEVFIGNMELRSLTPANYRKIIAERTKYEHRLRAIIEEGNKAGAWSVRDPQVTSYATIAALTGVCTWYNPRGRLSQSELIDLHIEYVFHSFGLDISDASGPD